MQASEAAGKLIVNAGDRHVDGNSVDAALQAVAFQQGDASRTNDLQRSAVDRQALFDAMVLKAQADSDVMNLQARTYNPEPLPRDPGPAHAVMPAQQVQGPSSGSLLLNMGSSVLDGYKTAVNNIFSAFKL